MQTRGFDQISVQDLLDDLGVSKGAFYHYFDSKAALLEAVVQRMVAGAMESVAPVLDDADVTAPAKVGAIFGGIASWKNARRDVLLNLMRVWLADDNAIVREKFRREVARGMTPVLTRVVAQGVDEGSFHIAAAPEHTAAVFVSMLLGLNEAATRLYVRRAMNEISFDDVRSTLIAHWAAFERILGAPPGSLGMLDDETLHLWFE
jgi:AcrR family transcriptional regulator